MTTSDRTRVLPAVGLAAAVGLTTAVAVGLTTAASPGPPPAGPAWAVAAPGFSWSFPRDHWAHPGYKTEWWYFTGHLVPEGETAPRFGYQFTLFRIGLTPQPPELDSAWNTRGLIMGHASISDRVTGRHVFSDVLHREIPLLGGFGNFPDSLIAWSRGPAGTRSRWELRWNGRGFDFSMADRAREIALSLSTSPRKPRVFQGPGGYSRKGSAPSAASLYYSFTRLATEGTVQFGDGEFHVRGQSWMDKEFGSNQLSPGQVGWDWFSLQLDDGRDLMLYLLRDASGATDFGRGTVVSPDGAVRYLTPTAWAVEPAGTWTSPRTGTRYPSGWTIRIPSENLQLEIRPLLDGQENVSSRSSRLSYWEGAVEVLGPTGNAGRGYVELTGYGDRNRPSL